MKLDIKTRLRRLVGWDRPDDVIQEPSQESAKPKQQWEKLASRGHQLLAQVIVIRGRKDVYMIAAGIGVLLVPVALWISSTLAMAAASSVSWIVEGGYKVGASISGGVKSLTSEKINFESTKAPKVAPIRYVEGKGSNDPEQILDVDQVRELMLAWGPLLDKGQPIPAEQCVQDKKIHEPWFADSEVKLRCRVSADKTRVWAWGYSFASEDPKRRSAYEPEGGGVAAVLYKAPGIEGWTLSRIDAGRPGTVSIFVADLIEAAVKDAEAKHPIDNSSVKSQADSRTRQEQAKVAARERFAIPLNRVPRSIAADFPELVLESR